MSEPSTIQASHRSASDVAEDTEVGNSPPAAVIPLLERFQSGALPAPLTPFIGRSQELGALGTLLARDDVRLVTLTGPGGVGKTRLALEAARQTTAFPGGVIYAPLATVQGPDFLLSALTQAFGLTESDAAPPVERLADALQGRRALLLLDNVEHLVGETTGTIVASLLQLCPGLTILATSRTLLRVSGEHTFIVPPLAVPRPAGARAPASDFETLRQYEAVQLFVDRARAAWPPFTLTAENAATVAAICERVDGLPLAIELAAARSAVLAPAALLERLERRLPLLTGGPHDQPQRLRTMQHAIAWSYDLLDAAPQAHLRRLAVFVGGFDLAAAEAVATLQERDTAAADVLDSLGRLLTNSLLTRQELPDGTTRYGMLETVREFALSQLQARGEEDVARAAHAGYFLEFMEQADLQLWATTNQALLDRIDVEHDNLRAALAWAIAQDPDLAVQLSGRAFSFWEKRSFWSEGRSWLEQALEASNHRESRDRAIAIGGLAGLACHQGDFVAAKRLFEECLTLADREDAAQVSARALRGLGIIASNQSDFALARTMFEQALARFQELADKPGVARCLNDLGLIAARQGDNDTAIRYQEQAVPIAREVGDDWQVCVILGNLGGAYYDRGDYARGEALSLEALELSRQLDDTFGVAINLYNLGNCVFRLGDTAGALVRYRESLEICDKLGERHLATRVLDRLGVALHRTGHTRAGARLIGAAATLREAIGDSLYAIEDAFLAERFQEIRAGLGEAAYDAAWESGRSLPISHALREAMAQADAVLLAHKAAPAQALAGLTVREAEVLKLLTEGYADKEIADRLYISPRTASTHVAAVIGKLGVDSRTAAVAAAFRRGLV